MLNAVANFLFAMREALPGHPDWCHSCCKLEPVPEGGAYRVCIECGHVYVTAQDLLDRYNEEYDRILASDEDSGPGFGMSEAGRETDPEKIAFCQECIHDF